MVPVLAGDVHMNTGQLELCEVFGQFVNTMGSDAVDAGLQQEAAVIPKNKLLNASIELMTFQTKFPISPVSW